MQQELIEMLEEIIQYVEVWNAHDQSVLDKAEALIEKAKNTAPAVPQGALQVIDAKIASVKAANIGRGGKINSAVSFALGLLEDVREAIAATPAPAFNGWYCAHCQRGVDGSEVTYHEQHTVCGRVITDDVPPAPAPAQEVGLTDRQFDLICQAIDKADTVTMDGDYMLDSDDCIRVVRVMQVLFDIAALRAKENKL